MAIAVDRVNIGHVDRLRHLKEIREERALKEWQALRQQHEALLAQERGCRNQLDKIYDERDACHQEFARFLVACDVVAEHHVTHHRLRMEEFDIRAQQQRVALDETRARKKELEAQLLQSRVLWRKASAATRKWDLIKSDVTQSGLVRDEVLGEIESEDSVRRSSPVHQSSGTSRAP